MNLLKKLLYPLFTDILTTCTWTSCADECLTKTHISITKKNRKSQKNVFS